MEVCFDVARMLVLRLALKSHTLNIIQHLKAMRCINVTFRRSIDEDQFGLKIVFRFLTNQLKKDVKLLQYLQSRSSTPIRLINCLNNVISNEREFGAILNYMIHGKVNTITLLHQACLPKNDRDYIAKGGCLLPKGVWHLSRDALAPIFAHRARPTRTPTTEVKAESAPPENPAMPKISAG